MSKAINICAILLSCTIFLCACTPKDNRTVLQYASWGSKSEVDILKPILSEFEKENPTVKIDFMHIPQNYFQKIHLLFASNRAPDVIFVNNLYLPIYANAGLLEDLSNNEVLNKSAFYPKSVEALSYKNKNYAVPRDTSNLVIYYNKNLFDKNNVPYPTADWTFDDFLKTAKQLTDRPQTFGVSFEEDSLYYLPYLMSEGGGILSDDLSKEIIDDKKSQKGLNFYADLRNKYHVAPIQSESASATMAQMFLQGRLAMHLSGRWLVPKYRETADFDWDVAPFPKGSNGSIVPMDASGWAISADSRHKTEAYTLIEFLSSKESIEKFTQSGLIVPARIDVSKSEHFLDRKKPHSAKVFIDIIEISKPTPVSINYNEVQDKLREKLEYKFNK